MNKIALALKEWFNDHGMSQQKVADDLGKSLQYVNGVCNGRTPIGKKLAKTLTGLYGLSESFLLTGEGSINEQSDKERHAIYMKHIMKANRLAAALSHLVDEGSIKNWMEAAPILEVKPEELKKATTYDPDGDVDYIFVSLVHHFPQFSLEWLLTGEGQMIDMPTSTNEEVIVLKNQVDELKNEMKNVTEVLQLLVKRIDDLRRYPPAEELERPKKVAEP